jgi:hypothetical protein
MKRLTFLLVLVFSSLLVGCANNSPNQVNNGNESTIPWNRPATWEGQGQLGGLVNGGR